jgi:replication factor C large subunit
MTDTQWINKHRPESFSDLQGNNSAIDRLKDWAGSFPDDRKPRLLVGPPGTGKTSTVEVIADWLDYDLVEMNASSARKREDVEQMARLITNTGATGERRIVLLDEVDSWHGSTDLKPLYDALDKPANIVFATCNDKWETPSGLTNRCDIEDFKLGKRSRKAKLKKVAEAEDVEMDDEMLESLAERPDLRSAINDLQVYAEAGEAPEDDREWEMSEWDMVDNLLTGTPERGDNRPSDVLLWIDENASKDLRGLELAWTHEALSRLDVAIMQDKRAADAIADTIPELRLTEPYRDDGIGRDKEFPEWFRHHSPSASGGSAEAKLYRALSNYETGEVGLLSNYTRFRETILPDLQALDEEDRHELILSHGLSPEEYEALDISKAEHQAWREEETPTEGDGLSRTEDASAW